VELFGAALEHEDEHRHSDEQVEHCVEPVAQPAAALRSEDRVGDGPQPLEHHQKAEDSGQRAVSRQRPADEDRTEPHEGDGDDDGWRCERDFDGMGKPQPERYGEEQGRESY
jgi:predicted glycoside hydrolase/deacetylase ChbG (UPF0249 family)